MITSKSNERYKGWKKLLTKKGRKEQQRFIVEGFHAVEEAVQSGWPIDEVILSEASKLPDGWLDKHAPILKQSVTISSSLFQELSETESPQGVAAVVKIKAAAPINEWSERSQTLLMIDRVQDPGNLGTLIRTADAAGLDGVLLGKGCVDLYSGKVLRATQGSIFHLPIQEVELDQLIPQLQSLSWTIYGTGLAGAVDYRQVERKRGKWALLVGNEGDGVAPDLLNLIQGQCLKLPMRGKAESLNVAVAAGILIYYLLEEQP